MNQAANDNTGPRAVVSARPCPICGKPAAKEVLPFCSKRCADVDLHRWFGEGYRVPVADDPLPDGRDDED